MVTTSFSKAFGLKWLKLRRLLIQLAFAVVAIFLSGVGFWLLEPTTPRLIDGLWLAFTTASSIGYGDLYPTTTASRLLAVPVLLLGFAVLSLITAAIAATWVESQERQIKKRTVARHAPPTAALAHRDRSPAATFA